jgi:hypothetical protein
VFEASNKEVGARAVTKAAIAKAVTKVPVGSSSVKSIADMWVEHEQLSRKIDALPEGTDKADGRRELQSAAEKILALQFRLNNEAGESWSRRRGRCDNRIPRRLLACRRGGPAPARFSVRAGASGQSTIRALFATVWNARRMGKTSD